MQRRLIFLDHYLRPVVIIGPLAEPVCDKLVMEWPYKFARSLPGMDSNKLIKKSRNFRDFYADFDLICLKFFPSVSCLFQIYLFIPFSFEMSFMSSTFAEMVRLSSDSAEKDLEGGKYIDYSLSRRGTSYACITQDGIKEVMQKVNTSSSLPHLKSSSFSSEQILIFPSKAVYLVLF